jgi:predicted RNA binding protein YcfA (HicA-like mRNA interferase family)
LPKLPRITPKEAEEILFASGFSRIRGKGSHRVYIKDNKD